MLIGGKKRKQEQVGVIPPMKQQPSRGEGLSKTFWWDCWVWVTPKTPRWDVDKPRGRK
jgi:hypothetical protein